MKKFPLAAGLALVLAAGSALAADLPSRKGPPPVYMPPPPMITWNGLYGGVNIGYGFGANSPESGVLFYPGTPGIDGWASNHSLNGVLGGGQIGYNWQFSPWLVLGVEADIQAADLNSQRNYIGGATFVNSAQSVDWFGTARGRVGIVMPSWPNLMLYGTGGFAYGQLNHTVSATQFFGNGAIVNGRSVYDDTATGWTAGGGVEWIPMSFPSWSLKVEYLYTDLGTHVQNPWGVNFVNAAPPAGGPFLGTHAATTRWHTVRAGLNWHFNPFGGAPVMAKY